MNNNVYDIDRIRLERELKDLTKQNNTPAPENMSNWPTSVIQSAINSLKK
ncbi:hypothetical protein [Brevibacillus brevis]|nr:hypothetical protein [Brevibacillus brevis]RED28425.1 hypothetical protein DES34_108292 [Brevibacillus brevis]GEC90679.1 hypothetical protein BBR01nite_30100 [Brevibacillus brevis]VEF91120.1 Uncharacterised protein [Brevibacillus brevis]